ncbi:MAG: ChuX/HutX family heme-like substrate-binding protein [Burkholderiaceae bacterium]
MSQDLHTAAPPDVLLCDPDALRLAWRDLLDRQPHLHGPDAAARLGVPEAALIASRIGHGATPLRPDLARLLDDCADWGKVLVAVRNRMGVALGILDDATATLGAPCIRLASDAIQVGLDAGAASFMYLFDERDGHGHTVSLNWFDGAGDAVGRVFLMSKNGRERAVPRLLECALDTGTLRWRAAEVPPVAVLRSGEPDRILGVVDAVSPQELGERVVLGRDAAPYWSVRVEGPGATMTYRGPLAQGRATPPAVHATDMLLKLHLRMQAAVSVRVCEHDDGSTSLQWVDAAGGTLSLAPQAPAPQVRRWIDGVVVGSAA